MERYSRTAARTFPGGIARACAALAMIGAALWGCSGPDGASAPVNVYMYSDYIDPELVGRFAAETGAPLNVVVYENSEEMLAKMSQAAGDSQFDVVVASDVTVPALIALGLVQPIDQELVPNRVNVSERFLDPPFDPGAGYSLPYQWGTVGLMYRTDRLSPDTVSWGVFFDPARQAGPFVLIDSMRDMLGVTLRYLGYSMNTSDLEQVRAAGELLLRAKSSPYFVGFIPGVGGVGQVLAGEAVAAVVYNGDAVREIDNLDDPEERARFAYRVPAEGGMIWTDVMLVAGRAPNRAGAHRFIDFILDPVNGAQLSNFNRYATPNAAAMPFIDAADRDNPAIYPPEELAGDLEYLIDLGAATRIYDETWTAVKAR